MMIQAVLGNPSHPEYGVATIPFPIGGGWYVQLNNITALDMSENHSLGDFFLDTEPGKATEILEVIQKTVQN